VVRLGTPDAEGFPRTTQVMAGLDFIVRKAVELERPVAVNLSFGNTYGSHDGTGLLERYMDQIAQIGRSVFVVGTGNEGDKAGHTSGNLKERVISRGGEEQMISRRTGNHLIELSVAPYETGFSVQLWKNYEDDFEIYTTYENIHRAKPNPDYYRVLTERLNVRPEECLMVGNDVGDDMIAETLGMKVFLLTDCLINKTDADISVYPNGSFPELMQYIDSLRNA